MFDYRCADFDGLRRHIQSLDLSQLITENSDINQDWLAWKNAFLGAVSKFVPSRTLRSRNHLPWMNSTILYYIKKKNSIRMRIKRSCHPSEQLKHRFRELRTTIKRMLRESRLEYINSTCASREHNPKRFWSFFKIKSKVSNIPLEVSIKAGKNEYERAYAKNNAEVANTFNEYFASIFTHDDDSDLITEEHSEPDIILEDITLTNDEVITVLANLNINKAFGPDGIPARLLTETSSLIAPSLCALFNKSLRCGVLPDEWKLANVVPVYKRGVKSYVENYRPISLLPLISKALERCVFRNIEHHVFQQINPCQHGFVPRKSCITQLIEVFEHIGRQLDNGKQIDVIYLDMSKAFDKVSHTKLLHRLREFGFKGNLLNWFSSYLSNRYQQTTVAGATSRPLAVTSGVPQGSILGPLLFLLYENHLSETVSTSNIATFADDTKIFKPINSVADAVSLQQDLTNFQESFSNANLELNTEKCKVLRITRKLAKIDFPYKLHNSVLERTDHERDLGVWTTSNLTWSKHIEVQCAQATKMLGYIRRTTLDIKTISLRRTLYLTFVRSKLCYASQVWAPQSVELIKRLERIQRRASKFILDLPFMCEVSYTQRLDMLDLLPLCYWHEFLDLVFFFKCIHGMVNINNNVLPPTQNRERITRSADTNCLMFITTKCRTATFQKSFLSRCARVWNILPNELTSKNASFGSFKNRLYNYYKSALDIYDVEDPRTWKSICLSCNMSRNLSRSTSCCY